MEGDKCLKRVKLDDILVKVEKSATETKLCFFVLIERPITTYKQSRKICVWRAQ